MGLETVIAAGLAIGGLLLALALVLVSFTGSDEPAVLVTRELANSRARARSDRVITDGSAQQLLANVRGDIEGMLELISGDRDSASPDVRRALDLAAEMLRESLDRLDATVLESKKSPDEVRGLPPQKRTGATAQGAGP